MKLMDWQTVQRFREIRRLLDAKSCRPPRSHKKVVGPILNLLRKVLWRAAGITQALNHRNQRLIELIETMEISRPPASHQPPDATLHFRPDTYDWSIFYSVCLRNEYRLPEAFTADDVLIDIGTHIGSFSFAALSRGAGRIYAFEVDQANFDLAARNLRGFGDRAKLFRKAVWRSDRRDDALFAREQTHENTGGGSILWNDRGEPLQTVALDDVIEQATQGGRQRIKLIKIDCEGSEYPILLTSSKLHLVDAIHGEYHEILDAESLPETARVAGVKRFDRHAITHGLERAGFRVGIEHKEGTALGLFFAKRG